MYNTIRPLSCFIRAISSVKEALYTLSGIWAAYTHVGSFLLQMLWCKRKLGKIALSFSGSISISHFPHSFCILPLSPPLSTLQRSFFLWFWVLHPFVKSNAQMCATISKSWKMLWILLWGGKTSKSFLLERIANITSQETAEPAVGQLPPRETAQYQWMKLSAAYKVNVTGGNGHKS